MTKIDTRGLRDYVLSFQGVIFIPFLETNIKEDNLTLTWKQKEENKHDKH